MNCRRMERLLSDHLEGLLPPHEAAATAAHLSDCPACRSRLTALIALEADLRKLPELLPPSDVERQAIASWSAEQEAVARDSRTTLLSRRIPSPSLTSFFGALQPPARVASLGVGLTAAVLLSVLMLARWEHGRAIRPFTTPVRTPAPVVRRSGPDWVVPGPSRARGAPNAEREGRVARLPRRSDPSDRSQPALTIPYATSGRRTGPDSHFANHVPRSPSFVKEDPVALNGDPVTAIRRWAPLPQDEWDRLEAQVRHQVPLRDDFVQIPFPRLATTSNRHVVAAVESYKREAAIVDPRLAREVSLARKAVALSDLCDRLRSESGVYLTAGASVADEKVTVFCEKLPLRDVMRQLSRPFGYTWLRSRKALGVGRSALGSASAPNTQHRTPNTDYRYELVQDLRSQLEEENLRTRDLHAALLALEREIERFRPYLDLSRDEAEAHAATALPAEKGLLEQFARGWGPIQMYFRLSPADFAALRAGQTLSFQTPPSPGQRPVPPDLMGAMLERQRADLARTLNGAGQRSGEESRAGSGSIASALPEWGKIDVWIHQSELGQLTFEGIFGAAILTDPRRPFASQGSGPIAVGMSPAAATPNNAPANIRFGREPSLRERGAVQPQSSCHGDLSPSPSPTRGGVPVARGSDTKNREPRPSPIGLPSPSRGGARGGVGSEPKVTSADVLEALHRATGLPIVADFYTRLYKLEDVSVKNQPLFDALNHLADAMHMRWNKENGWLQLRSAGFYNDRLKEVPNRLLAQWSAARRRQGALMLDDLLEIAQLPDAQLDGAAMAEGARVCWGLEEWDLARNKHLRPYWRLLAQLTPARRQEAASPAGLAFTRMTLPQQQQFIALTFGSQAGAQNAGLEELARAALNVDYAPSGWFEWRPPMRPGGPPSRWPVPARVREHTREAALQAARRIDPQVDESQIIRTEWAASVRCMLGAPERRYSTAGADVSPHFEMYYGPSTQASAG